MFSSFFISSSLWNSYLFLNFEKKQVGVVEKFYSNRLPSCSSFYCILKILVSRSDS